MAKNLIWVEGDADVKFIKDLLVYLGHGTIDVIPVDGWTNINRIANLKRMEEIALKNGGTNFIIFDADTNPQQRRKEIIAKLKGVKATFEVFLFPNNQDSGNLESLLSQLILPEHAQIFSCFEQYQDCLIAANAGYKVPALKTKIYAYVDTLLPASEEKKAQESKRDYLNTNHWNLNAPVLDPLKEFLMQI